MKRFTFVWFIENFNYFWHKPGEVLISPVFEAEIIEDTSWILHLYPSGRNDEDFMSLYLKRLNQSGGPEKIAVSYELSIADINGEVLECAEVSGGSVFEMDDEFGKENFCRRQVLVPETLKVCCKMWTGFGKVEEDGKFARSQLLIERVSFINVIKNFSSAIPNGETLFQNVIFFGEVCKICFAVYNSEPSDSSKYVVVKVFPEREYTLIACQIYSLNSFGEETECGKYNIGNSELSIPLNIEKMNLSENNSEQLPTLTLRCECVVSGKIISHEIEEIFYDFHLSPFRRHKLYDSNIVPCPTTSKSISTELGSLYIEQIDCDLHIRTPNKTFSAHKAVLCARSSVFRAMLTTNMKEKLTDWIEIDDLDDNTIDQFLLFLYTDALENIQWESALKLYYAADKYNVQGLKHVCTSFLIERLNTCNFCDLLLLADRHQNSNLRTDVENFICNNGKKIFFNNNWERLMEADPVLAMKTMHFYLKKSKLIVS